MITDKQITERKNYIGGSDVPIILGISSYKTPYQLYLEKLGIIESKREMTEQQYWGTILEPIIISEFEKRNNKKVLTEFPTFTHKTESYLCANVDGLVMNDNSEAETILEVKCSHQFMASEWGTNESDVIPMQYLAQVAHYCHVLDIDRAYIAVLIGGNEYRQYCYNRDKELEETLLNACKEFWQCIQDKKEPKPITDVDLRLMFPKHAPDKILTASKEIQDELRAIVVAKDMIKFFEKSADDSKFKLMEYMQDAECLQDDSGKILATWKTNKAGNRTFLLKVK